MPFSSRKADNGLRFVGISRTFHLLPGTGFSEESSAENSLDCLIMVLQGGVHCIGNEPFSTWKVGWTPGECPRLDGPPECRRSKVGGTTRPQLKDNSVIWPFWGPGWKVGGPSPGFSQFGPKNPTYEGGPQNSVRR